MPIAPDSWLKATEMLIKEVKEIFNKKLLFTFLNLYWKETEYEYRDNILMNVLFFINPESVTSINFSTNLRLKIKSHRSNANYVSQFFAENENYFFKSFLPKYLGWIEQYEVPFLKPSLIRETNTVYKGAVIFNKNIGFNIIHKIDKTDAAPIICFKRAGYNFDPEQKQYLWDKITFFKKCILYA